MGSKSLNVEERLRSLLHQLQIEAGVLDRMVYKNKNQHRRASYFQYLLKVRRDLSLFLSADLGDIFKVIFPIIDERKPAQNAFFPMRVKKKGSGVNHTYQERLLGVARLVSQMAEPIIKAAVQISLLLAKSFFPGFSITIMAMLGRLRVLIQQLLLDIVLVFNKVLSLSQKKQSVKVVQGGIEAFREYQPLTVNLPMLECVWKEGKYMLIEKSGISCGESQDEGPKDISFTSSFQYEKLEILTEAADDEDNLKGFQPPTTETYVKQSVTDKDEVHSEGIEIPTVVSSLNDILPQVIATECTIPVEPQLSKKKVAYISVRKPCSESCASRPCKKVKLDLPSINSEEEKAPLIDLLASEEIKNPISGDGIVPESGIGTLMAAEAEERFEPTTLLLQKPIGKACGNELESSKHLIQMGIQKQ